MEYIIPSNESKVFNTKLGTCNYDKELNYGIYPTDTTDVNPISKLHSNTKVLESSIRKFSKNIYFHMNGINMWFRDNYDVYKGTNSQQIIYQMSENNFRGYAIPAYNIPIGCNVTPNESINVKSTPNGLTHKNVNWKEVLMRGPMVPFINYGGTSYNNYNVYYNGNLTIKNNTYSFLTLMQHDMIAWIYLFSNYGPTTFPLYPKNGRLNLMNKWNSYHTAPGSESEYLMTFPYFYLYFKKSSFSARCFSFAACPCICLSDFYAELK